MSSREQILSAVRRAGPAPSGTGNAARARLQAKKQNVRPARSAEDEAVVSRFFDEAERAGADVRRAVSTDDIPEIIADYQREHNLAGDVRVSADPLCDRINWQKEPMLTISTGPAEAGDTSSVSIAMYGVAETGTLLLASSRANPGMLSFLPLLHIAIVKEKDIVGGLETAWKSLRSQNDENEANMPRMINLITGPSRTADIEQELLMGAHGPQNHMIIVLNEE